jgi:hypothetical protein
MEVAMLKNTVLVMIIAQILGSPVPAQITSMPEREILSYEDSAIRLDTHPDTLMMRCGDHFLYAGQNSEVPILMVDLKPIQTDKGKRLVLFVMLKRNVRVEINNAKSAPTVEVTPGPKFILRINRHDYGKAERCLPRPPGA